MHPPDCDRAYSVSCTLYVPLDETLASLALGDLGSHIVVLRICGVTAFQAQLAPHMLRMQRYELTSAFPSIFFRILSGLLCQSITSIQCWALDWRICVLLPWHFYVSCHPATINSLNSGCKFCKFIPVPAMV